MAACEQKLSHYAGKNKWKQICKDVFAWRNVKPVHLPDLRVDRDKIQNRDERLIYFGEVCKARYFVAIKWLWTVRGVSKGFEDQAYTDDPDAMLNVLYRRLFAHSIDFCFDPDEEHVLLFKVFAFYYRRRFKQKQAKDETQRKVAREKYEASQALATVSPPSSDCGERHDDEGGQNERHNDEGGQRGSEDEHEQDGLVETASLLMEEQHPDTEAILARATHVLGGDKYLLLFGEGPNTKAVAFVIGDAPKELIHWRYGDLKQGLIAFKPNGEILFTRCSLYHCSRTIAYYDKAYSFFRTNHPTLTGERIVFCPTCYFKMWNALYFGGHDPLGLHHGLLPSHNLQ